SRFWRSFSSASGFGALPAEGLAPGGEDGAIGGSATATCCRFSSARRERALAPEKVAPEYLMNGSRNAGAVDCLATGPAGPASLLVDGPGARSLPPGARETRFPPSEP